RFSSGKQITPESRGRFDSARANKPRKRKQATSRGDVTFFISFVPSYQANAPVSVMTNSTLLLNSTGTEWFKIVCDNCHRIYRTMRRPNWTPAHLNSDQA